MGSNDHQVRIIIDDVDLLGKDYLGIDPPEFFTQANLYKTGELLIARCTCGELGCGDYILNVSLNGEKIIWSGPPEFKLEFDKSQYFEAVKTAKNDHSWEDKNRRVERYVSNILKHTKTKDGYTFEWASARIKDNTIFLSYKKLKKEQLFPEQCLFEIKWDGQSFKSGVESAEKFLKATFNEN
jgi:hypothetical protein